MIDYDLHIHCSLYSTCATQIAEQAIRQAKNAGIRLVSICNHNTIDGLNEIKNICLRYGMEWISGVELSVTLKEMPTEFNGKVIHLLGYGFNPKEEVFNGVLENINRKYKKRIADICCYLRSIGYSVDVCERMKDLRMQLVQKGYFLTEKNAKEFLTSDEFIERFPEEKLDSQSAIDLIHGLGGKVFLAHPNQAEGHKEIVHREIIVLVNQLCKQGLDGLEVFHPNTIVKSETIDLLLSLAKKKGLLISLGSDTHHYKENQKYFTESAELKSCNFDFEALGRTWEEML